MTWLLNFALRHLWKSTLSLSMAVLPATAQITVDGSASWDYNSTPGTYDANQSDKLVVLVSCEHGFPENLSGAITGITYNGQALTQAVDIAPGDPLAGGHGQTTSAIWYLDDPALYPGAGTIVVTTVGNNWVASAIGLSGTNDGVGATATISGAASVSLTTTSPNSLVLAAVGMGGQGNTAGVNSVDPDPPLTEITALEIGNNWCGHVSGYANVPSPAPATYSFDTPNLDIVTIAAEFPIDTAPPDTVAPTLASSDFVDDVGGGPITEIDPVLYTVTFSEAMNVATVEVTDFENAGSPAATINNVTVTGDPAVFEVLVSPGGAGALQLQAKAGAILEDLAGNTLDTALPISDDTSIIVTADVTPPLLAGSDIVDDIGGNPAYEGQPIYYTVTFNEGMDASSVDVSDFENGGTAALLVEGVSPTDDPDSFIVTVIPSGAGSLVLQVKAGALLTDFAGNALNTSSGIPDDTAITVNAGLPPSGGIPNQSYATTEEFEFISPQLGTRHLNQPSVFNGYAVFAGNAIHEVWDISNPYAPTLQATMTSSHASGEAESHQVTYGRDGIGNYYLATTSGRGIDIWNVTDVTNPRYVKALELPGINYGDVAGGVWGLTWQGDYLYIGATSNGLYVIDVSNPADATHVATLPVSNLGGIWPGPVFALGNLLVVTTPKNRSGIATVDISDPLNPVLLDSVNPSGSSYIGGFYGTQAWLITPLRGYDVTTDPSNITLTATSTVPDSEYMAWADDYFFLGGLRGGTEGIWKYDATDPNNLQLEGRVVGRDSRWDDQFCCPVGNLLLISDDQRVGTYVGGLVAVHDVQPDTLPISVKHVYPESGSVGQPLSGQIGISFSEWVEFRSVNPSSFILRKVGGSPVSGKWGCTYTTLTFAPDLPLDPNSSYEVVLPAGGITDFMGNAIASTFASTFVTAGSGGGDPDPGGTPGFGGTDDLEPVPPVPLGTASNFAVKTPQGGDTYNWDFGDGASDTGASVSHTYSAPGRYSVQFEVIVGTSTTLEAEDAVLAGVSVASNHAGFTGTGFADYGAAGSTTRITWNYNAASAATVDLTFRYANGAGPRPLNLYVNGGSAILVPFNGTGAWTTWTDEIVPGVPLQAGTNTFELVADAGSSGANVDHLRFPTPGGGGQSNSFSFTHIVHNPLTASKPTSSQPVTFADSSVWAVNPDSDTITELDRGTLAKLNELPVGSRPKAIARAPDGTLWVVCEESWEIKVVAPGIPSVIDTISLPHASRPVGIAMAPDGSAAYVTLQALGRLVKLNPATRTISGSLDLALDTANPETRPKVRGVAVNAASDIVYVTRLVSPDSRGEIYEVDAATMTLTRTIALAKDPGPDSSQNSRGLPNYLTGITISPDGTRAWVTSKKDNIDRGGARDGLQLLHDVTVRAITSTFDTTTGLEVLAERKDHDNSERCHSCTFSELGDVAFVTLPGNNEVTAVNTYTSDQINTLVTEEAPEGAALHVASGRLFVLNFLGRSMSVFDVSDILNGGSTFTLVSHVPLVASEPLSAEILEGKRTFYDASSLEINQSGYMSCASCHLDDSQDGRVYDFTTPIGEGFRNTIDLRGRAGTGHGRVHWTANFDEIHDFEGQLRLLGNGTGLMDDSDFLAGTRSQPLGDPKNGLSGKLDALSSYVESLDSFSPSPYRNPDGTLTADALAGKTIFNTLACYQCHGGEEFTDSALGALHDVGTIKATSGQRLGGPLTGLDTPTLRGIWETAPYLHDGSAASLREVLTTANSSDLHGATSVLTTTEMDQLVAYLRQIDGSEPAAAAAAGVDAITYDNYAASWSLSGPLSGPDEDADGDGWKNIAEMVFGGTNPVNSAERPALHYSFENDGGADYFQISWLQLDGGTWDGGTYRVGDIACTPEGSLDLDDWIEPVINLGAPAGFPDAPAGYRWARTRLTLPIEIGPNGYLRVRLNYGP